MILLYPFAGDVGELGFIRTRNFMNITKKKLHESSCCFESASSLGNSTHNLLLLLWCCPRIDVLPPLVDPGKRLAQALALESNATINTNLKSMRGDEEKTREILSFVRINCPI